MVLKIYEIQNIGKGIITAITPANLLLLTDSEQGVQDFEDTLNVGATLQSNHFVDIIGSQFFAMNSNGGGFFRIASPAIEVTYPNAVFGRGVGNLSTDNSFRFYSNRTEFIDGVNNRGIEYSANYEPNFLPRTLITLQKAQSLISAIPAPDGSETKLTSGININITGIGTIGNPYIINNTYTADGSETKINSGVTTTVSGNGTIATPYIVEEVNNQKILTYPGSFTGTNYTLTNSDFDNLIFVNNGATNVTITVPTGLVDKFYAAFIQQGSGNVTFVASGTTINTPVGLKIKGQNYQVCLDKVGATTSFHLTGNTIV